MRKPSDMIICEIPVFFSKYIFSGGGGVMDRLIPHVLSCSFGPKQHPATRKTSLANFFRIGEAKWCLFAICTGHTRCCVSGSLDGPSGALVLAHPIL